VWFALLAVSIVDQAATGHNAPSVALNLRAASMSETSTGFCQKYFTSA